MVKSKKIMFFEVVEKSKNIRKRNAVWTFFFLRKIHLENLQFFLSHVVDENVWSAPHVSLVCGGFNEKKMRVHVSSAHFLYTDFFAAPKKNI